MNEEQKIEITTKGQYKNIRPKDLDEGNYIIVEKVYAEGYERKSDKYKKADGSPLLSYSCKAIYLGEEVSFFLSEPEHDIYRELGGIGDTIKMIKVEEKYTDKKGVKRIKETFKFDVA